jgi:hypothetical protein
MMLCDYRKNGPGNVNEEIAQHTSERETSRMQSDCKSKGLASTGRRPRKREKYVANSMVNSSINGAAVSQTLVCGLSVGLFGRL